MYVYTCNDIRYVLKFFDTYTAEYSIKSAYMKSLKSLSSFNFIENAMTTSRDVIDARDLMISHGDKTTVHVSQNSTNKFPLLIVVGKKYYRFYNI